MSKRAVCCAIVVAVCLGAMSLAAHQITFKGTVIASEPTTVKVNVVDEKTKKISPMKFDLDDETKILRGDTLVTFAQAKIQKDEKIAVTVDHDLDMELAIVVRLDARK